MKYSGNKLLIILTFIVGSASPAFAGLISGFVSASKEQEIVIQKAQDEVEKLLPPQMFHYLQVSQDRLDEEDKYKIELRDAEEHFAGSSNKKRILINSRLLTDAQLLRKTLIHEWSHVYDHLNLHSKDVAKNIKKCSDLGGSASNGAPKYCDLYRDLRTTISTTPRFLDLAGFFPNPSGVGRVDDTAFTLRSPDLYEIKSPHETFAVNMEYFTLDPAYKCRRPSLYNLLKSHFHFEPFPNYGCNSPLRILTPSFKNADKALPVIDPSRIYQIHYLLADRGTGMSSTFGHSMFRLIVCSPLRTYVGPDCLKDIQSHLVLSFRAFIDTPEISNIAGLSGDYPSRLFFVPFLQVVSEYNKTEQRDLMTYPLQLSDEEKKAFIERAVEIHWSYNGQYRFISNNCAVESMNLIRSIIKNDNFLIETAQTPFGLLDVLHDYKITNKHLTKNRDWANKNGYLLLSYEEYYKKALETISTITKGYVNYAIGPWMELSPQERLTLFNRWFPISDKTERNRFVAAFLMLENQAERLFNESLQDYLLRTSADSSSGNNNVIKLVQEALELNSSYLKIKGALITPAQTLKSGYGIPSDQDLYSIKGYLEEIAIQKNKNSEKLDMLYSQIFSPERFLRISQIRKNIDAFSKALKN